MKIHATPISLGGIVLVGILLVIAALAWIASRGPGHTPIQFAVFAFLFLGVVVYGADAWSESLTFENGIVTFDSALRPKKRVNACAMTDVRIVHEGLNQERGIVSVVFREPGGATHQLALGPMWHQHELETFLRSIEETTGECTLVEHMR